MIVGHYPPLRDIKSSTRSSFTASHQHFQKLPQAKALAFLFVSSKPQSAAELSDLMSTPPDWWGRVCSMQPIDEQ